MQLTVLNLGNNLLEEVPEEVKYLTSLKNLHLFGNRINRFASGVCGKLVKEKQYYSLRINPLIFNNLELNPLILNNLDEKGTLHVLLLGGDIYMLLLKLWGVFFF